MYLYKEEIWWSQPTQKLTLNRLQAGDRLPVWVSDVIQQKVYTIYMLCWPKWSMIFHLTFLIAPYYLLKANPEIEKWCFKL